MSKQTAVEWLEDQIFKDSKYVAIDLFHAIEEAKEMEKQQIKEAYDEGYRNGENDAEGNDFVKMDISMFGNSENYFNETYKGGKNEI